MADESGRAEICSLHDARVQAVLDRLHGEAKAQKRGLARLGLSKITDRLAGRKRSVAREAEQLRDLYVPLSPKQGTFAYMVTRSLKARRVVEFGTSFGVSTIYLAAAVRDNGGGTVIGSEFEPNKVATARANIEQAGLSDQVEIREGDARQTLKDPGGPVELLLLDGHKDLYVEILEMLKPHLTPGAVVLADNIFTFRKALAPYRTHMRNMANGFQSVTLFLGDGTEYSIRL
jgi:predicted O-methyltransferase YrrM